MDVILDVENLKKSYGKVSALKGIDFPALKQGEIEVDSPFLEIYRNSHPLGW